MLAYEYRNQSEIETRDRDFTINLPPDWSLFPQERRHSLYGVARQELGPRYRSRSQAIIQRATPIDPISWPAQWFR